VHRLRLAGRRERHFEAFGVEQELTVVCEPLLPFGQYLAVERHRAAFLSEVDVGLSLLFLGQVHDKLVKLEPEVLPDVLLYRHLALARDSGDDGGAIEVAPIVTNVGVIQIVLLVARLLFLGWQLGVFVKLAVAAIAAIFFVTICCNPLVLLFIFRVRCLLGGNGLMICHADRLLVLSVAKAVVFAAGFFVRVAVHFGLLVFLRRLLHWRLIFFRQCVFLIGLLICFSVS